MSTQLPAISSFFGEDSAQAALPIFACSPHRLSILATADTHPISWGYNCVDTQVLYHYIKEVFITDDAEYPNLFADDRNIGYIPDQKRFF
jgi:hypothetical protein